MSGETVWGIIFVVGLWVGMAGLHTALGRNDKKAWPISWARTFAGWLIVAAPPVAVMAFFLFGSSSISLIVAVVFSGLIWAVSWKLGARLPVVGEWIGTLHARELERAEKGIL